MSEGLRSAVKLALLAAGVWWRPWTTALILSAALALYFWIWTRCDPIAMQPSEWDWQKEMPADVGPTDYEKKHLIIGAGFCGLGLAAALKRNGIPFDVVEATDHVGGNWTHGVYETAHIISSRATTEFKDYPMPADYPDFPSCELMCDYLHDYADHYDLNSYISFETTVENVAPVDGGSRWRVTLSTGEERLYGGVIVAIGHHWACRMPDYPGQSEFTGVTLHSKEYKNPEPIKGKRVLVVGGGNSACDVVCEASRFASAAHLSVRRGYWFLPRTVFGYPLVDIAKPWMPILVQRAIIRLCMWLVVGPFSQYGLPEPDHKVFERHPTINSELLLKIRLGDVMPHGDIAAFSGGKTVTFTDGSSADFDVVVFATGYHTVFPMVEPGVIKFKDGLPDLINGALPVDYRNFYVFGTGQPRYGAGPLITAGAQSTCDLILIQPQLRHPVGAVLKRLGRTAPKRSEITIDIVIDPHEMYYTLKLARIITPWLPLVDKWLMPAVSTPTQAT